MVEVNPRLLAKASGAAQRTYLPAVALVHITDQLPLRIRRQGQAVIEALDLLRYELREATLRSVIEPEQPRKRKGKTSK